MRTFDDKQLSNKDSTHKSLRRKTTPRIPSPSRDDAGGLQGHVRAIRLQIHGDDAYLSDRRLAVRPAAIFDHLPAPRFLPITPTSRAAQAARPGAAGECKTGGTELRRGVGSTKRADEIARANERGGITCYLINDVCHQAANRILFPAEITVRGARGYEVSEALFGTYGRPGGIFGLCKAPFDQHAGTTGDLPACTAMALTMAARNGPGRAGRSGC